MSDPKTFIYTDGEDFWKWDHTLNGYRVVDFSGQFYDLTTHPACSEEQLVEYIGNTLRLATETDILWRTVNMILDGLQQAHWIPNS